MSRYCIDGEVRRTRFEDRRSSVERPLLELPSTRFTASAIMGSTPNEHVFLEARGPRTGYRRFVLRDQHGPKRPSAAPDPAPAPALESTAAPRAFVGRGQCRDRTRVDSARARVLKKVLASPCRVRAGVAFVMRSRSAFAQRSGRATTSPESTQQARSSPRRLRWGSHRKAPTARQPPYRRMTQGLFPPLLPLPARRVLGPTRTTIPPMIRR